MRMCFEGNVTEILREAGPAVNLLIILLLDPSLTQFSRDYMWTISPLRMGWMPKSLVGSNVLPVCY